MQTQYIVGDWRYGVANVCVVPMASMVPRLRQGLLRPRARHLGTQRQDVQHFAQLFTDHGPTNHQYSS